MSSWYPPNQLNNGRQMAPLQPTQMRPYRFQGSEREDLVSRLEALVLSHTDPAARAFDSSHAARAFDSSQVAHAVDSSQAARTFDSSQAARMFDSSQAARAFDSSRAARIFDSSPTARNLYAYPLYHHHQQQPIGSIGHPYGPISPPTGSIGHPSGPISQPPGLIHPPRQLSSTSAAPLYASAASSAQYIPTAASSAAAVDASIAAATAASYQRRHIIKCGRCYGEMKPSVSFHGWLGHCAHGRTFAPKELDYQICNCNLAFMTAYEMENHLRTHGCYEPRR